MKRSHLLFIPLLVVVTAIACLAGGSSTSVPEDTTDYVATGVAQTLQALLLTEEPQGMLPGPLYYRAPDGGGILQIYRLDRDGVTVTQLTFEPANVSGYDVNPLDGSLAYVANNQLLRMNADGSGRQMLVDGGALDPDEPYLNTVSSPVWSPDGGTIAFGYTGLSFYSIATGTYATSVANVIDDVGGLSVPREMFSPMQYSPDGLHILLFVGWYEGGSYAIYTPAISSLVDASIGGIFLGATAWLPDSSGVYVASPDLGMVSSGLWRLNLNGSVDELMGSQNGDGTFNFADAPWFSSDGQMYYFYGSTPDYPNGNVPLQFVRSGMDGVTGRTGLMAATFVDYNDITWAPDGSLFIVTRPPAGEMWGAGPATVYFVDGTPAVQILPAAQDLRWGP